MVRDYKHEYELLQATCDEIIARNGKQHNMLFETNEKNKQLINKNRKLIEENKDLKNINKKLVINLNKAFHKIFEYTKLLELHHIKYKKENEKR